MVVATKILAVILLAIICFTILYFCSTISDHRGQQTPYKDRERFNTTTDPGVVRVFEEINTNIKTFNDNTTNVNNQMANVVNTMQSKFQEVSRTTSNSVGNVRNQVLDFENKLSNLQGDMVTKNDLIKNYLTTDQVKDVVYQQGVNIRKDTVRKAYVESEMVSKGEFHDLKGRVENDTRDMGMRLTGLNAKQSDVEERLLRDYGTKELNDAQYAKKNEFNAVRDMQDVIFRDFSRKSDFVAHRNEMDSQYAQVRSDIRDLRDRSDAKYVTHTGLNDTLHKYYTPVDSHNNLNRQVNETLLSLNDALMRTIEYNSDDAVYTKMKMMDDRLNNMDAAVQEVKKDNTGISETSIDRNELLLGRFRLSGVEPDNMIKVFNRDKTEMAGGISANALDAKGTLTVGGATQLRGPVKLGASGNRPILVNGYANVEINGAMKVDSVDTKSIDVDSINAKTLTLGGKSRLDPDFLMQLDDKIRKVEERLDLISATNAKRDLPLVVLFDRIDGNGESENVQYDAPELEHTWQGRISSVQIAPGVKSSFYNQNSFSGTPVLTLSNYRSTPRVFNMLDFELTTSATKTWDKAVKSIRIEKI